MYHYIALHDSLEFRISIFVFSCRLNAPAKLTCLTPTEVAAATVEGMLKNKKYVILPSYASSLVKILL